MLNGLLCYTKGIGTAVYQRFLVSKPAKEKNKMSNSNTVGLNVLLLYNKYLIQLGILRDPVG